MDILNLVTTKEGLDLIDSGTWIGDVEGAPGVEFLVIGYESKEAKKFAKTEQEKMMVKNRNKPLSMDQINKLGALIVTDCVLKGWRGITQNGEELVYTQELARELLLGRGGERMLDMISSAARRLDLDANQYVDDLKKS